jgi:hypothetical protein
VTSKSEREEMEARAEFDANRAEKYQAEIDKRSHLVDPLTDPSSGDPPAGISDQGDRLGTIPVTRNAVADTAQAEQEGLDAAGKQAPSKAEKASKAKPRRSAKQVEAGKSKLGDTRLPERAAPVTNTSPRPPMASESHGEKSPGRPVPPSMPRDPADKR